MYRSRRINGISSLMLVAIIATSPASAGVIRYVVGEKTSIESPELKEHFRPSDVYRPGHYMSNSLYDPSGRQTFIPQDKHLGIHGSMAIAWNKAGDVVGKSYVSANENYGFLYRNGGMTYLTEQVPMTSQGAYAINDKAQIVGGNYPLKGLPYFYEDGAFVPLEVLPGFDSGRAIDINESGLVVGSNFQNYRMETGVLYVGTQPYELSAITQGLDGRLVGETHAITDDNRIVASLWELSNGERRWSSPYWLEPVILETGDVQEIWNEAKAAVTGGGIPLSPDDNAGPDSGETPPSSGGTTVVDTGTEGGFWTTPTDEVIRPDETEAGGQASSPQPVPVPEPMSIVMWCAAGSICLVMRLGRGRTSRQDANA